MPDEQTGDDGLGTLLEDVAEATSAFIGGHARRYAELLDHADDFTLMPPQGGPTVHGFDSSEASIGGMERFFHTGEATLEVVQTYISRDLAVLVVVERQRGQVGDYPEQDLSLRVTLVFRRAGTGWQLVHRHADALVQRISMDAVLALARGEHRSGLPAQ
jgi:ketosteroid isomerase-like protein